MDALELSDVWAKYSRDECTFEQFDEALKTCKDKDLRELIRFLAGYFRGHLKTNPDWLKGDTKMRICSVEQERARLQNGITGEIVEPVLQDIEDTLHVRLPRKCDGCPEDCNASGNAGFTGNNCPEEEEDE